MGDAEEFYHYSPPALVQLLVPLAEQYLVWDDIHGNLKNK